MEYRHRKYHRLYQYDYSMGGLYFITIVTQDRLNLFGDIANEEIVLNDAGKMIERKYRDIQEKFEKIECRDMVVMPNHIHFILSNQSNSEINITAVVGWFKKITTNLYIKGVREQSWLAFRKRLWQRDYYDHIIRNEHSLEYIQNYIYLNPARWEYDKINTNAQGQTDRVFATIGLLENGCPSPHENKWK